VKVPPLDYPTDVVKAELNRMRHPFRIAISRFKNPFNIGAIIRTAHSFLAQEIILIGDAPYYKRASMGMEKYENLVEVNRVEALVAMASAQGWNLVAFEKDHAQVGLWDAEFPDNCVLVMGNEDSGLGPTILDAALDGGDSAATAYRPRFGVAAIIGLHVRGLVGHCSILACRRIPELATCHASNYPVSTMRH